MTYVGWYPLAFAFVLTQTAIQASAACSIFMTTFGSYILQAVNLVVCVPESLTHTVEKLLGLIMLCKKLSVFVRDTQTDRQRHRQTDRDTDRQTETQTDQTDRQTD